MTSPIHSLSRRSRMLVAAILVGLLTAGAVLAHALLAGDADADINVELCARYALPLPCVQRYSDPALPQDKIEADLREAQLRQEAIAGGSAQSDQQIEQELQQILAAPDPPLVRDYGITGDAPLGNPGLMTVQNTASIHDANEVVTVFAGGQGDPNPGNQGRLVIDRGPVDGSDLLDSHGELIIDADANNHALDGPMDFLALIGSRLTVRSRSGKLYMLDTGDRTPSLTPLLGP